MSIFKMTLLAGKWSALGAFAVKAVVVMTLIALAAVATPYIAKFVDKHRKPGKAKEDDGVHSAQNVRGIFDASKDEDFDPNYKIYNTDIYGVDKKHGKKQR